MKILLYNLYFNRIYSIYDVLGIAQVEEGPEIFTTDRRLFHEVDAVVFNLPHLVFHLKENVSKPAGQIWVGWNLECERNYPFLLSEELHTLIDIWMTYHPDSDVPIPYLNDTFPSRIQDAPPASGLKDVCMFISSPVNHSRRIEYLAELMKQIKIDSYGRLFHNTDLPGDTGYRSKQKILSQYKFTIAFENARYPDYVTEKFYDPLLAGSVPVYLGAPNIDAFSPGRSAFVHVDDYADPAALAAVLREYCTGKSLDCFYRWKGLPLNDRLLQITACQQIPPFERLIKKIEQFQPKEKPSTSIRIGNGRLSG